MFRAANQRIQVTSENENVISRKTLLQPKRSALTDLHANQSHVQKKSTPKAKENKPDIKSPFLDTCSHCTQSNVTRDTMEDILPLSQRFTYGDIMNVVDSYIGLCKTPPPIFDDFEDEVLKEINVTPKFSYDLPATYNLFEDEMALPKPRCNTAIF